jgi:O-antigen/teichoic acid export membrane protein
LLVLNIPKKTRPESSIANGALFLTLAEVLRIGIGVITAIILAALLGPALLGINVVCALILRYGAFAQIGILPGYALLSVPKLADGDDQGFKKNSSIALTSILLNLSLMALVLWPIAASFKLTSVYYFGFAAYSVTLILFEIYNIQEAQSRFKEDFIVCAIVSVIPPVTQLVLVLILIADYGIYSVFIAAGASYLPSILILAWRGHTVSLHLDFREAAEMIKRGFPIFAATATVGFTLHLDKILVANLATTTQLGIFGAMSTIAFLIPAIGQKLSSIIFQSVLRAKSTSFDSAAKIVCEILPYYFSLLVFGSLAGYAFLVGLVPAFLPEYVSGLALLPVMLCWATTICIFWFVFALLSAFEETAELVRGQVFGFCIAIMAYVPLLFVGTLNLNLFVLPNVIFSVALLTYYSWQFYGLRPLRIYGLTILAAGLILGQLDFDFVIAVLLKIDLISIIIGTTGFSAIMGLIALRFFRLFAFGLISLKGAQ